MPRSILCVEDDEAWRALLRAALCGYDVVFARNAFEAIRAWNGRNFDAYVLEYWLPDWTGPALCRELRKADPHAPVIFYSEATHDRDRARGLRAGATTFISKAEVEPDGLAARIRTLLEIADTHSASARVEEERAIAEELERRMAAVDEALARAQLLMNSALERTARIKAMSAFFEQRGTKAHFERSWPQLFSSARANALVKS